MRRGFVVKIGDERRVEQYLALLPKLVPAFFLALRVGNERRDQLQDVLFRFDIAERISLL
jgi:hypothetical protein